MLMCSTEKAMLERTNCELWGYGSEVTGFGDSFPPELASRAHFTHASVAGHMDKNQNPPQYTIQDLMEINGHTYVFVPSSRSPSLIPIPQLTHIPAIS